MNATLRSLFSLTPDTGRVVLLSHLDMKGLSAGRLAANLGMLAACALAWRDGSLDFNNPWRMGLPKRRSCATGPRAGRERIMMDGINAGG